MSHFTVTVRLPAWLQSHEVIPAVTSIMRIYNEQGSADDDFMIFKDETEEIRASWDGHEKNRSYRA